MSAKSEDVLEDWEEIDEVKLNNKLDKLKKDNNKMDIRNQQNCGPMRLMMISQDDDYRTQYGGPPEPTVKILKRPTRTESDKTQLESKPKAPVKTLQQREQEYAKARLRILGSAKSPDDEIYDRILKMSNAEFNTVETNQQSHQPRCSNNLSVPQLAKNAQQTLVLRSQDNVIRMPKGPDGTMGFMLRR